MEENKKKSKKWITFPCSIGCGGCLTAALLIVGIAAAIIAVLFTYTQKFFDTLYHAAQQIVIDMGFEDETELRFELGYYEANADSTSMTAGKIKQLLLFGDSVDVALEKGIITEAEAEFFSNEFINDFLNAYIEKNNAIELFSMIEKAEYVCDEIEVPYIRYYSNYDRTYSLIEWVSVLNLLMEQAAPGYTGGDPQDGMESFVKYIGYPAIEEISAGHHVDAYSRLLDFYLNYTYPISGVDPVQEIFVQRSEVWKNFGEDVVGTMRDTPPSMLNLFKKGDVGGFLETLFNLSPAGLAVNLNEKYFKIMWEDGCEAALKTPLIRYFADYFTPIEANSRWGIGLDVTGDGTISPPCELENLVLRRDGEFVGAESPLDYLAGALEVVKNKFKNLFLDKQTLEIMAWNESSIFDKRSWEIAKEYIEKVDDGSELKKPYTYWEKTEDGTYRPYSTVDYDPDTKKVSVHFSGSTAKDAQYITYGDYLYRYGVPWQMVYAAYAYYIIENDIEQPERIITGPSGEDEVDGSLITMLDRNKISDIINELMGQQQMVEYDNNFIPLIQAHYRSNYHHDLNEEGTEVFQYNASTFRQDILDKWPAVLVAEGDEDEDEGKRVAWVPSGVPKSFTSLLGSYEFPLSIDEEEYISRIQAGETVVNSTTGEIFTQTYNEFVATLTELCCVDGKELDMDMYKAYLYSTPGGSELVARLEWVEQQADPAAAERTMETDEAYEDTSYRLATVDLRAELEDEWEEWLDNLCSPKQNYRNTVWLPYSDSIDIGAYPAAPEIYAALLEEGFSDLQAAAIMGNMMEESGLSPTCGSENKRAGAKKGLAGFSGELFSRLEDYATDQDKEWQDAKVQVRFLARVLRGEITLNGVWMDNPGSLYYEVTKADFFDSEKMELFNRTLAYYSIFYDTGEWSLGSFGGDAKTREEALQISFYREDQTGRLAYAEAIYDYFNPDKPITINPVGTEYTSLLETDLSNEQTIFNFLCSKGLPEEAVCGILGNIRQECGFRPATLELRYHGRIGMNHATYTAAVDGGTYSRQSFINDHAGYGLVQWTYSKYKQLFYDYAQAHNQSIGSMEVQLNYLWETLHYNDNDWFAGMDLLNKLLNNFAGTGRDGVIKAAQLFSDAYEKAGSLSMNDARIQYALDSYSRLHGTYTGAYMGNMGLDAPANIYFASDGFHVIYGNNGADGIGFVESSELGPTGTMLPEPVTDGCVGTGSIVSGYSRKLTEQEKNRIRRSFPANLSVQRQRIVEKAMDCVGVLLYSRNYHNTYKNTNLTYTDCSGFVDWLLYHQAGLDYGAATTAVMNSCPGIYQRISREDALPGDLMLKYSGGTNHVAIFIGWSSTGYPLVIDCTDYKTHSNTGMTFYRQLDNSYTPIRVSGMPNY